MACRVEPMTYDDIEAALEVRHAAFGPNLYHVWFDRPLSDASKAVMVKQTQQTFGEDPHTHWFKAVDAETNKIIGFCKWRDFVEDTGPEVMEKDLAPPPMDDIPEYNQSNVREFFSKLLDYRRDIMGSRPFYLLEVLVVHPSHQRKGAGKALCQWGIDEADKHGVEVYVEASEMGKGLYEKLGCKPIKTYHWPGDTSHFDTMMVRPAKAAPEA